MRYLALLLLFAACHAPVVPPPPDEPRKSGNVFGAGPLLGAIAGPSYAPVVNTSLDSQFRTQHIWCGTTPTSITDGGSPLTGRGQISILNTDKTEAWVSECYNCGPGVGYPLIDGGPPLVLPVGPDITPLCCCSTSAMVVQDGGPAICDYDTQFIFYYDAGVSLFDAGVCADGGTSCQACSGSCLADAGIGLADGGYQDAGLVYDGGCSVGGLLVQEISR